MAKSTRALSGAAKDAYLRRTLATERDLDEVVLNRLIKRLQQEIALVSLKQHMRAVSPSRGAAARHQNDARPAVAKAQQIAKESGNGSGLNLDDAAEANASAPTCIEAPCPASAPVAEFDPFSPNVIVVIRTRGREAVLAELLSIDDAECLRLLAREQQLGIASDLETASDIRLAIVAAAERRIANRRAAAS